MKPTVEAPQVTELEEVSGPSVIAQCVNWLLVDSRWLWIALATMVVVTGMVVWGIVVSGPAEPVTAVPVVEPSASAENSAPTEPTAIEPASPTEPADPPAVGNEAPALVDDAPPALNPPQVSTAATNAASAVAAAELAPTSTPQPTPPSVPPTPVVPRPAERPAAETEKVIAAENVDSPTAKGAAEEEVAASPPTPALQIQAQLQGKFRKCEFKNLPLNQFAYEVSDMLGVPIRLDEASLKQAGIDRTVPLSYSQSDGAFSELLTAALKPQRLGYAIEKNSIVIRALPQ